MFQNYTIVSLRGYKISILMLLVNVRSIDLIDYSMIIVTVFTFRILSVKFLKRNNHLVKNL